jgi:hypothetical protein
MLNLLVNYLLPPPSRLLYEEQLDSYNQNPKNYEFIEEQVNCGFSQLLDKISWDITSLSENEDKFKYITIFKEHATELIFNPYYYTHANSKPLLDRVIQVLSTCPKVGAIRSKIGIFKSTAMAGYLWWEKPIYSEEVTTTFYRSLLGNKMVSKIHTLRIQGIHFISVNVFDAITETQPKLRNLEIAVSNVDSRNQSFFDRAIYRLKDLLSLVITSEHLNDKNLEVVLKESPNIELLGISNARKVTRKTIIHIAHLPSLKFLKLKNLLNIERTAFQLLRNNKQLSFLSLDGSGYGDDSPLNDHETFTQFTKALQQVTSLNLQNWPLSPEQVPFFRNFKRLKFLAIGNFPKCLELNESFKKLCEANEHLKDLEVTIVPYSPSSGRANCFKMTPIRPFE